jgi:hypothetical protein
MKTLIIYYRISVLVLMALLAQRVSDDTPLSAR